MSRVWSCLELAVKTSEWIFVIVSWEFDRAGVQWLVMFAVFSKQCRAVMIYFPNLTNTHPSRARHISAVKRVLSGVLESSHQYLENAWECLLQLLAFKAQQATSTSTLQKQLRHDTIIHKFSNTFSPSASTWNRLLVGKALAERYFRQGENVIYSPSIEYCEDWTLIQHWC